MIFETSWASTAVNICRARVSRIICMCYNYINFHYFRDKVSNTNSVLTSGYRLNAIHFRCAVDPANDCYPESAFISDYPGAYSRLSYSIYLFHLLARTPAEVAFGSPYRIRSLISGLFSHRGLGIYGVYFRRYADCKYSPSAQAKRKPRPFSDGDRPGNRLREVCSI